ncbi:hypothetical protein I6B53_01410 [Schaalia sp. 19OD2882]|uniref:hypothetical protein n=1 Tax=Schaalia sp. 19OD2882 TaxID=2794089 RepID=UPI001C1F133D|nr:hypothetical protein [Schaalia sp. 19OD2882]QWW19817.1 hypothetical protein I6B53_01410 [Schaalia sp. 19OD2882]
MDQNLVKEIYHNYLPTISADLTTAADDLNKLKMEVRRYSGIGVGSNGPSPEFTVLLYKIWTAVKDLAADVDRGAANLEAAAADFATNDEKTAARLDETAGQVQAPTGYDRWPDS